MRKPLPHRAPLSVSAAIIAPISIWMVSSVTRTATLVEMTAQMAMHVLYDMPHPWPRGNDLLGREACFRWVKDAETPTGTT